MMHCVGQRAPVLAAPTLCLGIQAIALTLLLVSASPVLAAPTRRGETVPGSANQRATAATKLTVDRAISLALRQNPQIKLAALKQSAARLRVKSARGALLPRIKLEGNALLWNSAFKFEFPTPSLGTPPASCPLPESCMSWFGEVFNAIDLGNIRDQFTLQLGVTVAQPVTALFALLKRLKIRRLSVDVARIERRLKEQQLRFSVRKTYLQVLQAERYLTIARDAVKLIRAHQRLVVAFRKAEVIGETEVLRIKVALATARQWETKARAGVSLARAALRMFIGASPEQRFVLTEKFADPPSAYTKSLGSCQQTAVRRRPELRIMGKQRQMVRHGRNAAKIMLLPQAVVMASYQFNHGMGAFMPSHSFFAGVNLSWTWEWGSQYRKMQVLSTQSSQLARASELVRRGIRLEVRKHHLEVRTAYLNLKVSRSAVRAATEALRLERLRFGQGVKTATALLDTQARLDRAKGQHATALYGYYIGLAALEKTMGTVGQKKAAPVNKSR